MGDEKPQAVPSAGGWREATGRPEFPRTEALSIKLCNWPNPQTVVSRIFRTFVLGAAFSRI